MEGSTGIDHWSDENPDRHRADSIWDNCPACGFALAIDDAGQRYCPDCGIYRVGPDDGPRDTVQLYAYIQKGIAGAPAGEYGLHLTGDPADAPPPPPEYAYWALSIDEPPALIHVHFEGALPADEERDVVNSAVMELFRRAMLSQEEPAGE